MSIIKYFLPVFFVAGMIGCGNGDVADEMPPDPQQQPAPDGMAPEGPVAEVDISDEELHEFIDASMNAQQIQQESQQEMLAIADDEGIDVNTYNEIMQAQQMGQSTEELDVSDDDVRRYEAAQERIQEVEEGMENLFAQAIEESGMSMERFQEINMAVQQDPQLQQQLQMMMQEQQGMGGQPPAPQQDGY